MTHLTLYTLKTWYTERQASDKYMQHTYHYRRIPTNQLEKDKHTKKKSEKAIYKLQFIFIFINK